MKDPIKTIGQFLDGGERRDAIHIAIMPVTAAEDISRGEEIGLVYGTKDQVKGKDSVYGLKSIGVADPFIKAWRIKKGQRFYAFLHPNSVTGMRHEWTHPLIDDVKPPSGESEAWLRAFADKWNFDYDDMIAGACEDEGYVVAGGMDLHGADELAPGDEELFWKHVETLTGRTFDGKHRENFGWSCSC